MTLRRAYVLAALTIFAIEILIALYVKDGFVRPYLGDVLAVTLVYCVLRAAIPMRMAVAIGVTLAIATAIEIAQFFDIAGALGLGDNPVVRVVLGGAFDPMDFAAYAAGAVLVVVLEAVMRRRA